MEKKVLLFSGGFDSMLQEWLIKPDVLLHVNMQTSYSKREIEALENLPVYYKNRLIIKYLPIGEYERENKYLPYRNLMLATIAMQYGQHVYFGFNELDNAPDKDEVFIRRLTSLFRHLNMNARGDMGWRNKNFGFYAPFIELSKTEMVKMCLEEGMSGEQIKNIRSCYDGSSVKGCGICNVCRNKAIALLNNGLYEDSLFDIPIGKSTFNRIFEDIKETPYDFTEKYKNEVSRAYRLLRQEKK